MSGEDTRTITVQSGVDLAVTPGAERYTIPQVENSSVLPPDLLIQLRRAQDLLSPPIVLDDNKEEFKPGLNHMFGIDAAFRDMVQEAYDKYIDFSGASRLKFGGNRVYFEVRIGAYWRWISSIDIQNTSCCGEKRISGLQLHATYGRQYVGGDYERLKNLVIFTGICIEAAMLTRASHLITMSSSMEESPLLELLAKLRNYNRDTSFLNVRTDHICSIYSKRLDSKDEYDVDWSELKYKFPFELSIPV